MINVPSFEISQTEVTVAQFRACVEAGVCNLTDGNYLARRERHPLHLITWYSARQYAHWVGAELPSRAQWVFAASSRGERFDLPEVDSFCDLGDVSTLSNSQANEASCNGRGTSPVCFYAKDITDQGICDMNGNVSEYLLDDSNQSYETFSMPLDGSANCAREDCISPLERKAYAGKSFIDTPEPTFTSGWLTYEISSNFGIRLVRPIREWTVQVLRPLSLPAEGN